MKAKSHTPKSTRTPSEILDEDIAKLEVCPGRPSSLRHAPAPACALTTTFLSLLNPLLRRLAQTPL